MTTETTKIELLDLPTRSFAYVHNVGPYKGDQELFGKLFSKVTNWAGPKGYISDPSTECITVYHDDLETVPDSEQRISAGFTVAHGTEGEGDIQIMEIPAGKFVVGSFEILPEEYGKAWDEVMGFISSEKRPQQE